MGEPKRTDTLALTGRERFPRDASAFDKAVAYITQPGKGKELEVRYRDFYSTTCRPGLYESPHISSEALMAFEDVEEIPNFDEFTALLSKLKVPGTDNPLFEGSGSIFMINPTTGESFFSERQGFVHKMTGTKEGEETESLVLPGGLADYTIGKAGSMAMLHAAGRDLDMSGENNDWLVEVSGVSLMHMGGAAHVNRDGDIVFGGGSGLQMNPEGVHYLEAMLSDKEGVKDHPFTGAGHIDCVATGWALRIADGDELSVEDAQREIEEAFAFLQELDEADAYGPERN